MLPLAVIGSTLYALLPGMEFAPLAAIRAGADAQQAQAALSPWFLPILMTGAITFALGSVAFAKAIADAEVLGPRLTWLVTAALVIVAITRFVPLAAVQFYVQGAAVIVALLPLAYAMGKQPQERLARQPESLAVS